MTEANSPNEPVKLWAAWATTSGSMYKTPKRVARDWREWYWAANGNDYVTDLGLQRRDSMAKFADPDKKKVQFFIDVMNTVPEMLRIRLGL